MNCKIGKYTVILMTGQVDDSASPKMHFSKIGPTVRGYWMKIAKVVVRGRCFGYILISGK